MDEVTKRRLKHNEELFREVNEAREEAGTAGAETPLAFVCECSDPACAGVIRMTRREFERVRAADAHYVVLPGHEIPELERIVEDRGAFEVVEKDAA